MDIFVAKGDFRNTDVVSAIEATGHRVTWNFVCVANCGT